jgi:uncharacterized RDD family membrane protein YckC
MTATAHWGLPDPATSPKFYARVPSKRALAWCVDMVLIVGLCVVLLPLTAFLGVFFFPLLLLVVGFIYRWFSIANRSATPGMRLMGIELRSINGQRLTRQDALLHTFGYSLSLAIFPLQLISIVMMLTTAHRQGLTDTLLGTTALNHAH